MIPARGRLVLFAKAPIAGAVKTRMCPPFSPAEAAALAAAMLADALATSAEGCRRLGLEAVLALHPPERRGAHAREVPTPFRVVSQRGPDLAARMAWAVREAAAAGVARLLLRGSDSPTLGPGALHEALDALERHDVVMRPDPDGGYDLVGLRRLDAGLFEHPMSTARVLEDTRARALARSLSVALLAPGFDVDTVQDLAHLARARATGALPCPHTLAFLDRNDLWRHARSR